METGEFKQALSQSTRTGQSKKDDQEKKNSLKTLLKEEEPQKLVGKIDKTKGSHKQIDEYITRITGIETKVIETARAWQKILKEIIIEEGREVLEMALTELEQELQLASEQKNIRDIQEKAKPERVETETRVTKEDITNRTKLEHNKSKEKINEVKEKEKKKDSIESLIYEEARRISKLAANQNKTAIEILFGGEQATRLGEYQLEDNRIKLPEETVQGQQTPRAAPRGETKEIDMKIKEEILENTEDLPERESQREMKSRKEQQRKQTEPREVCYEEPGRNSLEDSLWAPNENTCEGKGTYRAKIASVSLPGESREERIKFVRGTIYRSNHISKIEECFIKGNTWVVISFDCLKGIELLKERLNKKKSEWYKILFEEHEEHKIAQKDATSERARDLKKSTSREKTRITQNKEKRIEEIGLLMQEEEEAAGSSQEYRNKGKSKDFAWVTLWDLPLEYSRYEIKRLLKNFGSVEEIRTQRINYCQVAEAKIFLKNEEQEEKIRANWVISLENGKLT